MRGRRTRQDYAATPCLARSYAVGIPLASTPRTDPVMSLSANHDRRAFLAYFSSIGLGSTLLPGVLWAAAADAGTAEITKETIACAEEIAGVHFTDEERAMMVRNLKNYQQAIEALHKITLDNSVAPALVFDPVPPGVAVALPPHKPMTRSRVPLMTVPNNIEELAFQPVTQLSELVRQRKLTPTQLTRMYLGRVDRFDPQLHAVITVTRERALEQAKAADEEIARGKYRGPLHGIPWGAKDLLAVKGYPTTWGAGPYKTQVIDHDAAVVQRLDAAGAILIAKLTLGELAQGDVWYGGVTRNPWWPLQGSSGSSAGPAAATAAGLVAFSIGTETQGSISSPSTRVGVTGMRPTFGRVPRTGAMALAWTMDKIGPICRSVEDCALVFDAIHGPDHFDAAVKNLPFTWNANLKPSSLRVGYFKSAFDLPERDATSSDRVQHATKATDDAALEALRKLGVKLIPVEVPDTPTQALSIILTSEAGAAFQNLVLSGRVSEMVQQSEFAWPNTFRSAQLIPAADYINANRARQLLMQRWWELFQKVDVVVTPTGGTNQLPATNLSGNPAVILPNGFVEGQLGRGSSADSTAVVPAGSHPPVPVSLTFLGGLYQEGVLLAVANAYQQATGWHTRHPPQFA